MPAVNPEILRWARETASLSLEEAARALHLGGVRRSGTEILKAVESGEEALSPRLLDSMVKVYRRPLLTFYLAKPPMRSERGEDFRTLPADRRAEHAGTLDALVRDVYVRQRLVRTTLEEAEEAVAHEYVKSIHIGLNVSQVAEMVKGYLNFDLEDFRRRAKPEEAFSYLRAQIEATGIYVILMGNLGSHHSNLSAEVFRGFALADAVAPFIIINDQDAKVAWAFTALHELIHIWLGRTGISGGPPESVIEKFCNDVASEILLPNNEFHTWSPDVREVDRLFEAIDVYAQKRNISRSLVNYRLFQASKISHETWTVLADKFREQWYQEKNKRTQQATASGGPDYYVVKRHRLGKALIRLVKRNLEEGILTHTKAGKVLGVRPMNVTELVEGNAQ